MMPYPWFQNRDLELPDSYDRRGQGCPGKANASCRDLAVESGFQGAGPGATKFVDRSGDKGLAVDGDFKALSASTADAGGEVAELGGNLFDFCHVIRRRADQHCGCGLRKKSEKRVDHQGAILLDRGADVFAKRSLRHG